MIELPDPHSPYRVADWIELYVAVNQTPTSMSEVGAVIESASGEEPDESILADIWRILGRRASQYQPSPYIVQAATIDPNPGFQQREDYVLCLLLALYGAGEHAPTKLFERLTGLALAAYLQGESIVIGFPTGPGQPTSIAEKTEKIAQLLNEEFNTPPAPRFKDRGLDVVSWKPFEDGRSGQVVILAQCAAGFNWVDKQPVPLNAWIQYIHWAVDPISAFVVPGVVADRDWHDRSRALGLVIDRVRILNNLNVGITDSTLKSEIASWNHSKLSDITI